MGYLGLIKSRGGAIGSVRSGRVAGSGLRGNMWWWWWSKRAATVANHHHNNRIAEGLVWEKGLLQ